MSGTAGPAPLWADSVPVRFYAHPGKVVTNESARFLPILYTRRCVLNLLDAERYLIPCFLFLSRLSW